MDRLTERKYGELVSVKNEETGMSCSSFCNKCSQGSGNCKYVKEMVEKLAVYEDLEEQGLLLQLLCKVGDTVYTNIRANGWYMREKNKPYKAKVAFIGINETEDFINVVFENDNMLQFKFSDFGKNIFLTHEEAEAALQKMKEDNQ